ncbi:hypothetical protein BGZ61DRAFT_523457 [Ilyonectria robusta]|uniref:uncharacterized protein n=1 Tax=Ilyonectria robusta TaxID=1079257 RepID=UPI001E8DFD0B|nr:uncharacterized protein BGZ61DRAFT_523457 [Ilyonectria robusta]KAH8659752.1 hypothetical protein BGZ61DRAFT_523457 [Ilyonectria robusta]
MVPEPTQGPRPSASIWYGDIMVWALTCEEMGQRKMGHAQAPRSSLTTSSSGLALLSWASVAHQVPKLDKTFLGRTSSPVIGFDSTLQQALHFEPPVHTTLLILAPSDVDTIAITVWWSDWAATSSNTALYPLIFSFHFGFLAQSSRHCDRNGLVWSGLGVQTRPDGAA